MRSSYEIRKTDDDTLLCIVEDRLGNFPYIRELYTDVDITKIVRRKRSLDNELLATLILNTPANFQLLFIVEKVRRVDTALKIL